MQFFKKIFAAILLAGLATSCINLKEEITLNADGSGALVWTVDLSEMLNLMRSLGAESGTEVDNMHSKMDSTFVETKNRLKGVPGISNIQQINNTTDFVYGISFDFKDVKGLNQALAIVKETQDGDAKDYLSVDGKKVQRVLSMPKMGDEKTDFSTMKDEDMEMMKLFIGEASYTSIINLPQKAKKASSKYAKLENGNRTVTTSIPLMDIMTSKGKLDMSNTISY